MTRKITRATVAFIAMTFGLFVVTLSLLTAFGVYAPHSEWGPVLVICVAMVLEFLIFISTLATVVTDWVDAGEK